MTNLQVLWAQTQVCAERVADAWIHELTLTPIGSERLWITLSSHSLPAGV